MDPEFVKTNKINCIRLIRQLSGKGLKESKEFFEQEWYPFVVDEKRSQSVFARPIKEKEEILRRLDAVESELRRLTRIETQQVAQNLFNQEN